MQDQDLALIRLVSASTSQQITQGDLTPNFPTFSNPILLNLNFYINIDSGSTYFLNELQNIELCTNLRFQHQYCTGTTKAKFDKVNQYLNKF